MCPAASPKLIRWDPKALESQNSISNDNVQKEENITAFEMREVLTRRIGIVTRAQAAIKLGMSPLTEWSEVRKALSEKLTLGTAETLYAEENAPKGLRKPRKRLLKNLIK